MKYHVRPLQPFRLFVSRSQRSVALRVLVDRKSLVQLSSKFDVRCRMWRCCLKNKKAEKAEKAAKAEMALSHSFGEIHATALRGGLRSDAKGKSNWVRASLDYS